MSGTNIWLVIGIILMIAEMLTTSLFLIFIALGCFAAALAEMWFPGNIALAMGICGLVSVVGAVFLRRPLQTRFLKNLSLKADVGREIQIENPIAAHQTTRVTYQGSSWQATNLGSTEMKAGDRATIVGIDGVTLLIRKSE